MFCLHAKKRPTVPGVSLIFSSRPTTSEHLCRKAWWGGQPIFSVLNLRLRLESRRLDLGVGLLDEPDCKQVEDPNHVVMMPYMITPIYIYKQKHLKIDVKRICWIFLLFSFDHSKKKPEGPRDTESYPESSPWAMILVHASYSASSFLVPSCNFLIFLGIRKWSYQWINKIQWNQYWTSIRVPCIYISVFHSKWVSASFSLADSQLE